MPPAPTTVPETPPSVGDLLRTLRRAFSSRYRQCEDARFLVADVPLHTDAARRLLPLGLRLADPPQGLLFVVDYRRPAFTRPYHEAGLLLRVSTPVGTGYHCCWMVVNDDTPLFFGRETLAYPKKLAAITFEESGDTITASVQRKGVDLITLRARKLGPYTTPSPIFGAPTFNTGGIGQKLGLCPIWTFRMTEYVHEAHALDLELTLGDAPWDPLGSLIAGAPQHPRMIVEDIAGARYLFPCGIAGPRWFANTFLMRFH